MMMLRIDEMKEFSVIGKRLFVVFIFLGLSSCSSEPAKVEREALAPALSKEFDLKGHLLKKALPDKVAASKNIPAPLMFKPIAPVEDHEKHYQHHLFSVSAYQVPVEKLLFRLAVDAHKQLSLDSRVKGKVTVHARNLPLEEILQQISSQVNAIYKLNDQMIVITPDAPYWHSYRVDYVNMIKNSQDSIHLNMSVGGGDNGNGQSSGQNNNESNVSISSNYDLWGTLLQNLNLLVAPQGVQGNGQAQMDSKGTRVSNTAQANLGKVGGKVFVNKEAGLVSVFANARLQEKVKKYLDQVFSRANKQVLIEATVVEVELSDRYQAGIDWSALNSSGETTGSASQKLVGNNISNNSAFSINLANVTGNGFSFNLGLKMLQQFGNTKVLSSPKIMAINNQTAILKVVDNQVYFTVEANTLTSTNSGGGTQVTTFTSQVHTVPVGFVMGVTPFVSDENEVSLNIRPTLSRIIRYVDDPNPSLAQNNVVSRIPVIQEREMSSVLRLRNRQTAIIGGLIQGGHSNDRTGVPFLSDLPWGVGDLFSYRDDKATKSELVIFIRPVVIKNPDVEHGDLKPLSQFMPTSKSLN